MVRQAGVLLLALTVGACTEGGTGPDLGTLQPGVNIIGGGNSPDTVGSEFPVDLVVQIADSSGRPLPDMTVRFRSVRATAVRFDGTVRADEPTIFIAREGEPTVGGTEVLMLTDGQGRARVRARAGFIPPHGAIEVFVPLAGVTDTVLYDVQPGRATKIERLPADTSVYRGASYLMRAAITDRYGNLRQDPLTTVAVTPGVTISGEGIVNAGPAVARGRFVVTGGGLTDTAFVSVVPEGRFVARRISAGFVSINLDGTSLTSYAVPVSVYMEAAWSPDGSELALTAAGKLYFATPAGQIRTETVPTSIVDIRMPTYALDGRSLYFTAGPKHNLGNLWRMSFDTDSITRITSRLDAEDEWSSVSPDGSTIAFVSTSYDDGQLLAFVDLATGARRETTIFASAVRWSPAGDWIALFSEGRVMVMRPDGTEQRVVSDPGRFYGGGFGITDFSLDWSSDGEYLLASFRAPTGRYSLDLIQVQTGLGLPLAWTDRWTVPRFRPE